MAEPLALYGAVVATVLGLLRAYQFWTTERQAVRVMAFVEQFLGARVQNEIVPVDKLEWSRIRIHLVNNGRPITIGSVGLLDRETGKAYMIFAPESLPVKLQRNDAHDVHGDPGEEWREAVSRGATFLPYAEDTGDRMHKGDYELRFQEQARKLAAQYEEWKRDDATT